MNKLLTTKGINHNDLPTLKAALKHDRTNNYVVEFRTNIAEQQIKPVLYVI